MLVHYLYWLKVFFHCHDLKKVSMTCAVKSTYLSSDGLQVVYLSQENHPPKTPHHTSVTEYRTHNPFYFPHSFRTIPFSPHTWKLILVSRAFGNIHTYESLDGKSPEFFSSQTTSPLHVRILGCFSRTRVVVFYMNKYGFRSVSF